MTIPSGAPFRSGQADQEQAAAGNGSAGSQAGASGSALTGQAPGQASMAPHRAWKGDKSETGRSGSEFGAFLDDLSNLARGSGQANELREELERRVRDARMQLSSALDQSMEMGARARDSMQEGIDYTRGVVSARPLAIVAIAAGVGMLVGMLISSRR